MIVSGFGVRLIRLRHEHIELVRQKRNAPEISRFMEYREEITPEMQEKWFASINNAQNNFFIIEINGEKIGLIYAGEIDWEKTETGNGGIFIWDEHSRKTSAALAASLLLTDTSFLFGFHRAFIKVLRNNPVAIDFNTRLGYELMPGQENVINQRYVLTEKSYSEKAKPFRDPFVKQFGDRIDLQIVDASDASTRNILDRLPTLPPEKRARINLILP